MKLEKITPDYESMEEPKKLYKNSNLLVLRTGRNKDYITTNLRCVQDNRLSWKAKGIHYYLLSRPDDWEIRAKELKQRSIDGKESLYSGIKELISFGYLFRMVKRNNLKQIERRGYYVSETPKTNEEINKILKSTDNYWIVEKTPYTENLDTENLDTENLDTENLDTENLNQGFTDNYNKGYDHGHDQIIFPSENKNYTNSSFPQKNNLKTFLQKRKSSIKETTDVEKNKRSQFKNIAYPNSKPEPKKKERFVSSEIETILSLWRGLGLKSPAKTTKTHEKNIANLKQLLSGKLLGTRYTKDQVIESIKSFALAATNLDYAPVKKDYLQSLYLYQFLHNPFSVNGDKSLFAKYLNDPPSPLAKKPNKIPLRDKNIYNTILQWYKKAVLGGMDVELSVQDENNFIVASNKLLEFYNKHKSQLNMGLNKTPTGLANVFCEALANGAKGYLENIEPYWLQSDKTFSITLPKFLKSRNMLYNNDSSFR